MLERMRGRLENTVGIIGGSIGYGSVLIEDIKGVIFNRLDVFSGLNPFGATKDQIFEKHRIPRLDDTLVDVLLKTGKTPQEINRMQEQFPIPFGEVFVLGKSVKHDELIYVHIDGQTGTEPRYFIGTNGFIKSQAMAWDQFIGAELRLN